MEKLFKFLSIENKYFNPDDALSALTTEVLNGIEDELEEEELTFIQAARGAEAFGFPDAGKETDKNG